SDMDPDPRALSDLQVSSRFTEDLRFLEFLDDRGRPVATPQRVQFSDEAGPTRHAPPSDLAERVWRRALSLRERIDPQGQPYVEVVAPVFRHGVHVGALRLGVSEVRYLRRLDEAEARHRAAMSRITAGTGAVTAVFLLFGVLAIWLLARRLSEPIVELTGHADRIRKGDLDVQVLSRSSDEVGRLATTMAEMVQGLKDRDFIKAAFGRFVTPALAERYAADHDALALGGQIQEVTILMSDLRGFTRLSAQLGPERMVSLLNRYLGRMTEVILAHDGMINEFIGDAILVLFGAPDRADDDVARAVRCAVDMQRAMVGFNRENREMGVPELQMGIGVNTGEVVAGNIGSEHRVKYGVVGDAVNLAARIESLTIGSQVLISAATHAQVSGIVLAEGPRAVSIKGKDALVEVFELLGLRGDPDVLVPRRTEVRHEVDLLAHLFKVDGKTVEKEAREVRVRRLGPQGLEVDDPSLAPLDNVKLRLELAPGEWTTDAYAKVVSVDDGEGRRSASLVFTSLVDADRAAIQRVTEQGQQRTP
ncbi:MAG: HAMP domain-containing protein, partial [Deltaproteobacteria bacterium]|nr:HAMP domain-containing protein [Deltaproteobacteria bacterium]